MDAKLFSEVESVSRLNDFTCDDLQPSRFNDMELLRFNDMELSSCSDLQQSRFNDMEISSCSDLQLVAPQFNEEYLSSDNPGIREEFFPLQ